jgi:hypothetical protein
MNTDITETIEQPKTVGQKIRDIRIANNSYVTGTAKTLDTKTKNGTFKQAAAKAANTCRERGITKENGQKALASKIANGTVTMEAAIAAVTKDWEVTNPEGETFTIRSLEKFCKEHGLDASTMGKVARGKAKSHKGWKCRQLDN